jgi:tryptophan synthase beta chain
VLLHQTIIGQETIKQMRSSGEYPDIIIGCVGGGSNFAGIAFPFLADKFAKKNKTEFIAVEPTACPSLTKGKFTYDHGDTAGMTPLLKMYSLGKDFVPDAIHAGGLRYHGMAPLISFLYNGGLITARSYQQNEIFRSAVLFAKTEGIIPAPESAHAIKAVIDEAMKCSRENKKKVIVFNLSGHGLLDLSAYDEFLKGVIK